MRTTIAALVVCLGALVLTPMPARAERVPILYSTDLFHPHDDPDDHYDLATLFALPELDIKGVILDQGRAQTERPGSVPVRQMMRITGRTVPFAIGLSRPLRTPDDRALDEPEEFQGAVRLILSTLRSSRQKVVLFTTGSCRDVAAAFNREPDLLRRKVRALYINIGRGPGEPQDEWNVGLDPNAFVRLLASGLPLYWCPCFGKDGYQTYYVADQPTVVAPCAEAVQNYFVYALTKSTEDPIAFLSSGAHPLPQGPRNMWCTGPLLHAAGRRVYERGPGDFAALPPAEARKLGLARKEAAVFGFESIGVTLPDPTATGPLDVHVDLHPARPNARLFRTTDTRYQAAMASCLRNLLAGLGRRP